MPPAPTNGHYLNGSSHNEPIESPVGEYPNGLNGNHNPYPNGEPVPGSEHMASPTGNGVESPSAVKAEYPEGAADSASISAAHVNGEGPSSEPISTDQALGPVQFRFCQSTVKTLKKLKDAAPFLRPVDPVALNIPHYPSIIKNPMDFGTIERKLASSNPQKPDPNPLNPKYNTADEFIADVRAIFNNCLTFNGPDHLVTHMAKRVEEVFDKQIKNIPAPDVIIPSFILL